ncbi:MAG: hypothetical protein ABIP94_09770 [Planctomycetota bacterium]
MNPSFLALCGGLLLFASDHPLHWWPLQLVPLLLAIAEQQRRRGRGRLFLVGLVFGLADVAPLLTAAGLAPPILVAAAAALVQWSLLPMLIGPMLARGPVLGALAAAGVVTATEIAI